MRTKRGTFKRCLFLLIQRIGRYIISYNKNNKILDRKCYKNFTYQQTCMVNYF